MVVETLGTDGTRSTSRAAFPWWVSAVAVAAPIAGLAIGALSLWAGLLVVVVSCGSVVGWFDATLRRVPNAMCVSLGVFGVVAALFVDPGLVADVAVGAVATTCPLLVLHVINPAWVGFGDVKLSAALGAALAVLSPWAGVVALWLAAVAAVVSRPVVPVSWRRSVPFGFWLSLVSVLLVAVIGGFG